MLAIRQAPALLPGSMQMFRRDLDDVFRRFWPETQPESTLGFPVNVHEDETAFHFEAELPGFTKDQVNIELEDGVLSISAEKKAEEESETKNKYHIRERAYSRVSRQFNLPSGIDPSKIDAKMEDGVLYLNIAKAEQAQVRQITID